jgi:Tfp pilus assembly protein PilN
MKIISINLVGERPVTKLALAEGLNVDPMLILTVGVGLIAALSVPSLLGFVLDSFLINPTQAQIDQIKQSIGTNKGKASQLAVIQKQAQALEGDYNTLLTLARQSGEWKTVLEEIRDLTPTDMWLTHLEIDGGKKLKLEGSALDYRAIAFFYTNMQGASHFSHPVLGGLEAQEAQAGQPVIRFTLDCDLQAAAGG